MNALSTVRSSPLSVELFEVVGMPIGCHIRRESYDPGDDTAHLSLVIGEDIVLSRMAVSVVDLESARENKNKFRVFIYDCGQKLKSAAAEDYTWLWFMIDRCHRLGLLHRDMSVVSHAQGIPSELHQDWKITDTDIGWPGASYDHGIVMTDLGIGFGHGVERFLDHSTDHLASDPSDRSCDFFWPGHGWARSKDQLTPAQWICAQVLTWHIRAKLVLLRREDTAVIILLRKRNFGGTLIQDDNRMTVLQMLTSLAFLHREGVDIWTPDEDMVWRKWLHDNFRDQGY